MVGLKLVASGFAAPMEFISSRDGRMFVVDQIGVIKVMTTDGKLQEKPFLDIKDRIVKLSTAYDERGLLGLAFHRISPGTVAYMCFTADLCGRVHRAAGAAPITSPSFGLQR